MVTAGTGETLPGPVIAESTGASRSITGDEPGSGRSAGRESEAAVVPVEP